MPTKRTTKADKPKPPAPERPERKLRGHLFPVTVGLPLDLVELLDKAAGRERRSRTNLIEAWLAEQLERKGYLPPQGSP